MVSVARLASALAGVLAAALTTAAAAWAAPPPQGALVQLPGARGCFSSVRLTGCRRLRWLNGVFTRLALAGDGRHAYLVTQTNEGNLPDAVVALERRRSDGATPCCST